MRQLQCTPQPHRSHPSSVLSLQARVLLQYRLSGAALEERGAQEALHRAEGPIGKSEHDTAHIEDCRKMRYLLGNAVIRGDKTSKL